MENKEKIGVGIVTYNRPELLKKLLKSLEGCNVDEIVIVNDGSPIEIETKHHFIQNKKNKGVGKSKNLAFKHLQKKKCEHFFLIEDDIYIKDKQVFEKYIQASKTTGIQHFNYSQHGIMNKTFDQFRNPNPRLVVHFGDVVISLYPHCVGAFSYYSKLCLDTAGLIDEKYYNACEHVDHTYEIIKKDLHPPFWFFADIGNSWELLGDEEWSLEKSTISSNPKHKKMMQVADMIFFEKHGLLPMQIPLEEDRVVEKLKTLRKTYGR